MKILILGASSFIGSYIKKYFEKQGYSVLGTYQTEKSIYKDDTWDYMAFDRALINEIAF